MIKKLYAKFIYFLGFGQYKWAIKGPEPIEEDLCCGNCGDKCEDAPIEENVSIEKQENIELLETPIQEEDNSVLDNIEAKKEKVAKKYKKKKKKK